MEELLKFDLRSPLLLVVELVNSCNLSCSYCYNKLGKFEQSELLYDIFEKIVDEAADIGVFDINLSGGEPFLHKDIFKCIGKILDSDLGISIVSNGTLINKNIAAELRNLGVIQYMQISFDSSISNIHNKTRGCFDKALSGFMNLVEMSENKDLTPSIGIVVNKFNYDTLCDTIEYFSNFTNRFHIMNVMKHPELSLNREEKNFFENNMLPTLKDMVDKLGISISILNNKYEKLGVNHFMAKEVHIDCLAGFTSMVIASNLEMYPCDVARHSIGRWEKIGSIKEVYENSKNLWKNRKTPWCI